MDDCTRRRLMASVRVGMLVIEELRAAAEEGRPLPDRAEMRKVARWAERELSSLVWNYYERLTRRAGYR